MLNVDAEGDDKLRRTPESERRCAVRNALLTAAFLILVAAAANAEIPEIIGYQPRPCHRQ